MSLTLRKDVKLGLGIGSGLLAVGGLYALMSIYGPSSNTQVASSENSKPVAEVVNVPVEPSTDKPVVAPDNKETVKTPPLPVNDVKHDPFAESTRTDGDVAQVAKWDTMFNSGIVPTGTATVVHTTTPGGLTTTDKPNTDSPEKVTTTYSYPNPPDIKHTTTVENAAVTSGKYVVQPGDTFSSIAGKLYGNKNLYHVLVKANPSIDPTKLKPKMEIILPAANEVKSVRGSVAPTDEVAKVIDTTHEYRVQAGDTLHGIALRLYGKSSMWASIYDANQTKIGPDAGKIKVGMILTLPKPPEAH